MTLEELTAQRDALLAARYAGRTVEIDGRRVTYASEHRDVVLLVISLEHGNKGKRASAPQEPPQGRRFVTLLNWGCRQGRANAYHDPNIPRSVLSYLKPETMAAWFINCSASAESFADVLISTPIRRTRSACCVRAASGSARTGRENASWG
jgi:hypothetical protein